VAAEAKPRPVDHIESGDGAAEDQFFTRGGNLRRTHRWELKGGWEERQKKGYKCCWEE